MNPSSDFKMKPASLWLQAYMFKYDSTHGPYKGDVTAANGLFSVDGENIAVHQSK